MPNKDTNSPAKTKTTLMDATNLNTHSYRIEPDLVVSPNGFGFRSTTGEVYRLNATAVESLKWILKGEEMNRVAQRLSVAHSIPLLRAKRDLYAFIEHMENLNLFHKDEL